jgi:hypothetical protein
MIIYTVTKAVRDAIVAALIAHAEDPRMGGALRRVSRQDSPAVLAGIISAWPAEADGRFRIALPDVPGTLVWRAYVIAEITAGRGRLSVVDEYAAKFGIDHPKPAFEYVCSKMRGRGVRPCASAKHDSWATTTLWIMQLSHPRKLMTPTSWRARAVAHEKYAEAGLTLPVGNIWYPKATILFVTPKPVKPQPTLTPADDAAIAELA